LSVSERLDFAIFSLLILAHLNEFLLFLFCQW
jgi:hypothetical protein